MRALLTSLILLVSTSSFSATRYVDKPVPVPSAAPCMVPFGQIFINANMVVTVGVGEVRWYENSKEGGMFTGMVEKKGLAFIVGLATGLRLDQKDGDLKAKEAAFLESLKKCGK